MSSLLSPEKAGPHWWISMHDASMNTMAFPQYRKAFIYFVNCVVKHLFPCEKCRVHYLKNRKKLENPVYVQNLFMWSVNLHNEVNSMLSKPQVSYSQAQHIHSQITPQTLFLAVWFTIHTAAAVVQKSKNSKHRRILQNYIYGVVPHIMGCKNFRATLPQVLTSNFDQIPYSSLVSWTLEIRNLHAKVMKLPHLQLPVEYAAKEFSIECPSCSISP